MTRAELISQMAGEERRLSGAWDELIVLGEEAGAEFEDAMEDLAAVADILLGARRLLRLAIARELRA